MSIFQPVSFAASLAFCPAFPIANDNWSSGTITCANMYIEKVVFMLVISLIYCHLIN